jgi:hypothetical protein
MNQRFEYGFARIKDLSVRTTVAKNGTTVVNEVLLDGRAVEPTKRFWTSLHLRFGFTGNIFRYFRHDEVFQRISEVAPNDRFRWCVERSPDGTDRLLAVTNPNTALVQHEELLGLLARYETEQISYSNGVVRSRHTPRVSGIFPIGGDDFQNKYVLDTPIDGFGRPSVYLSLLRLVCSNGAIGHSPAFRSELNLGRGDDGVEFALVRVLDGFNNEEGYAALRQRFESATRSWASVNEVNKLYKLLVRMHQRGEVDGRGRVTVSGDGASELDSASPLLRSYQRLTGDLAQIYGLANPDALSVKRQRTLPTPAKVYDLLNFASEVATHHTDPAGNRVLQAFLGELITGEYDLEGTADQFSDWKDFYVGNEATTSTLAAMHRR